MFSLTRLRHSDLLGFIRAGRHESSQRVEKAIQPSSRLDVLAFPFFLAILLAFTAPSGRAATNSPTEGDEVAIRAANPANSVLEVLNSDRQAIHHVSSMKCMIFHETLCQALKNRPIVVLATLQTAMLVSDGVTTRQFLRRGYVEVDPITRILIGAKPTWARMAPLGAVQVVAGMWLAERMSMSRHQWVRRFCWLPQMIGIAGNAAATGHNFTLH
jgi:hypothetical protein